MVKAGCATPLIGRAPRLRDLLFQPPECRMQLGKGSEHQGLGFVAHVERAAALLQTHLSCKMFSNCQSGSSGSACLVIGVPVLHIILV
jgi:hypothetical protein